MDVGPSRLSQLPSGMVTGSVSRGGCSTSLGPCVALTSSLPAKQQRACNVSEKEVSGLRARRFGGGSLLQHNLTCPDRSSEPMQSGVLSESLGGP